MSQILWKKFFGMVFRFCRKGECREISNDLLAAILKPYVQFSFFFFFFFAAFGFNGSNLPVTQISSKIRSKKYVTDVGSV